MSAVLQERLPNALALCAAFASAGATHRADRRRVGRGCQSARCTRNGGRPAHVHSDAWSREAAFHHYHPGATRSLSAGRPGETGNAFHAALCFRDVFLRGESRKYIF